MSEPNLDRWAREVVEQSKGSIWAGLGLTLLFHFVVQVSLLFILGTIVSGERALELAILPAMYIGLRVACPRSRYLRLKMEERRQATLPDPEIADRYCGPDRRQAPRQIPHF
jgi:hypothetical protein